MFQVQEKCSKCGKTFAPQMMDWYNEPVCPDCLEEYITSVTTNTDGDITYSTSRGKSFIVAGKPNEFYTRELSMADLKEMLSDMEKQNRKLMGALTSCVEEELRRKCEEINAVNISRRIAEIMTGIDKEGLI